MEENIQHSNKKIDFITHEILDDLPDIQKFYLHKICYDITGLYTWVVEQNKKEDPFTIPISFQTILEIKWAYEDYIIWASLPENNKSSFTEEINRKKEERRIQERNKWIKKIEFNSCNYEDIPENIQNDREIILLIAKKMEERRIQERDSWIKQIELNACYYKEAPEYIKNDREIALIVARQSCYSLDYLIDEFKDDYEIVMAAVEKKAFSFRYASENLKNNRQITLVVISNSYGSAYKFASVELRNDEEIVLKAIEREGISQLYYAGDLIKNNKNFLLSLMQKYRDRAILSYSSKELRNDKDFVLEAIKFDKYAIRYASEELKNEMNYE